jgi:hypothetical protein
MRYDLRRPGRSGRHTAKLPPVDAGGEHPAYDAYARRTRRVSTAVLAATLAVSGAAVAYFGVVGGLAALLADETGAPGALPAVSREAMPGEQRAGALDGGKAARPVTAPSLVAAAPAAPAPSGSGTPGDPDRPIRTVRPPRRTATPRPPVPTPAPHPTPTCSETPTPTPSASPGQDPTGEPSPPPAPPE